MSAHAEAKRDGLRSVGCSGEWSPPTPGHRHGFFCYTASGLGFRVGMLHIATRLRAGSGGVAFCLVWSGRKI